MKVLLNVAYEELAEGWIACDAVRLRENEDGSFTLLIRELRDVCDEMLDRALRAYARCESDPGDPADHEAAMREALAAALEIEP